MSVVNALEGILEKGVEAVIPDRLIERALSATVNGVKIYDNEYTYSGRLNVFGFGKAAMSLVKQTVKILGPRIDTVVCCVPYPTDREVTDFPNLFFDDLKPPSQTKPEVHVFYGPRNNEPNEEVVKSSLEMARISSKMRTGDLLLVCITGGGSSLLTLPRPLDPQKSPLDPSATRLSLKDVIKTTKALSCEGASIQEVNTVRSCLDCMKAGGLASFATPALVVSLILSDVIGDPVRYIASGPTYVKTSNRDDASQFQRALIILDRYGLRDKIPSNVRDFLIVRSKMRTMPTAVEPRPINHVIGNVAMSLKAAAYEAAKANPSCVESNSFVLPMDIFRRTPVENFECILPIILTDKMDGDMTERAEAIGDLSWQLRKLIQVFLRRPECTSRHVSESMRERLKTAQKGVTGKKEYYRDLIHACYMVAKVARQRISVESQCGNRLLSGLCLLFGGEATVKVGGEGTNPADGPVYGGRCSHAALAVAVRWFELHQSQSLPKPPSSASVKLGLYARASDGLDGPAAFGAGAWSTDEMIRDVGENETARKCLLAGDSYGFFMRSGFDAEKGHFLPARLTGTNVMDLFMCVIGVYN